MFISRGAGREPPEAASHRQSRRPHCSEGTRSRPYDVPLVRSWQLQTGANQAVLQRLLGTCRPFGALGESERETVRTLWCGVNSLETSMKLINASGEVSDIRILDTRFWARLSADQSRLFGCSACLSSLSSQVGKASILHAAGGPLTPLEFPLHELLAEIDTLYGFPCDLGSTDFCEPEVMCHLAEL